MTRRLFSTAVVLLAATAALVACSSSKSGSTGTPPAAPTSTSSLTAGASTSAPVMAGAVITIQDFSFMVPDSVAPGERVTVQNKDDSAHTVTADTGDAFDVKVPGSGTATFTAPAAAGSYKFHCTYHSNMHGTLIVQ